MARTDKQFDAVQMMRSIRDRISEDIKTVLNRFEVNGTATRIFLLSLLSSSLTLWTR